MLHGLTALSITRFHDLLLGERPSSDFHGTGPTGIWHWIEANHRHNHALWNEEDKARRTDVDATEIAASKRLIDQHNQKRNDAVESLDEAILTELCDVTVADDARLNSETAGAMIDRLSILSLKIFHMRKQTERTDTDTEHIAACSEKLQRLLAQRKDLSDCLDRLLSEAVYGKAYFKIYRQFKMYNDPSLNPYLYRKASQEQHAENAMH
jgi:hypothetical protein